MPSFNALIPQDTMQDTRRFALGRHLTIEYLDCDLFVINDAAQLEQKFLRAARASGATIISSSFRTFSPQGVSGFIVIAESHFSVHTWPEHGYAAVDIFTCSDTIDVQMAIDLLQDALRAKRVAISADMGRGMLGDNTLVQPHIADDVSATVPPTPVATSWQQQYEDEDAWGIATAVDVYHCHPSAIRDAEKIRAFVYELCDRIQVKRFGECQVVNFGEDERVAGYSMTQLIETSLVSGHFANATNAAYLDIFSCRYYDPRTVAEFASEFFGGSTYRMQVSLRH